MANRNFANSRMYTGHVAPVMLDVSIPIGSSGAVGTIAGPYIKSVTKMATGTYQIQLVDNYSAYYFGGAQIIAPASGSDLSVRASDAALAVGSTYVISVLGSATAANWTTLGVPAGVTPAVGVAFVALATGAGTSTTSKVQAVIDSGIAKVELMGNPNYTIAPMNATPLAGQAGAIILLKTLAPSFSGSALGTHTHNLIIKGGQAASTTNNIAAYAGPILGKEEATDATILGANSATNGGVVAASAGTPAGSISYAAANPVSGSILKLFLVLSNSSVQIGGE